MSEEIYPNWPRDCNLTEIFAARWWSTGWREILMTSHSLNCSLIKVQSTIYVHHKNWLKNYRGDARGDELTSPYFRAADPTEGQCLLCDQHATRPQLCPEEEGFAGGGGRPVEGLRLDSGQEERHLEGSQKTSRTRPLTFVVPTCHLLPKLRVLW